MMDLARGSSWRSSCCSCLDGAQSFAIGFWIGNLPAYDITMRQAGGSVCQAGGLYLAIMAGQLEAQAALYRCIKG